MKSYPISMKKEHVVDLLTTSWISSRITSTPTKMRNTDRLVKYEQHVVIIVNDSPKFSLSWIVELAHEYVKLLYKGDYALYNFFFENRDAEAETSFGDSEQNNPFLYVIVPERFRNTKLDEQLRQNSKELHQPASNFTELDFKPLDESMRGSSLLRRFQDGMRRTCKTLPIPFQFCICQYEKTEVTDESLKDSLGQFVVAQLSSFLERQNVSKQCEEIKLKEIEAKQYLSSKLAHVDNSTSFFEVTFEVAAPAKGRFQIPVRKELEQLDLGGALFTRLDTYGKSGDCMSNEDLRPFCTCKKIEIHSTSPSP
ncbi:hypothetical protein ANCCEY_12471 [Ancylostoma ceylanicum]|uniref:Uncharacterized protein n=1 Tax=Ancylostoma ceylanicum TaxID=53326 RepID=A0A0D6LLE2_9BILA|nr:hypothetical protein ANCCEY_12471 [Ancylostoma ceylanicum]